VNELEALTQACEPATFGRANEDVLDETYRKAGKMDRSRFATQFDLAEARLLDVIRGELLRENKDKGVVAELYKLNVYGLFSSFFLNTLVLKPSFSRQGFFFQST
jgi:hypothetical protein